ncbi:MAG: hypothetical protein JXA67_07855 [Micromonosporaceae bacterium]|nr:hypothetical protein [Micromonosporaceae bacterium]
MKAAYDLHDEMNPARISASPHVPVRRDPGALAAALGPARVARAAALRSQAPAGSQAHVPARLASDSDALLATLEAVLEGLKAVPDEPEPTTPDQVFDPALDPACDVALDPACDAALVTGLAAIGSGQSRSEAFTDGHQGGPDPEAGGVIRIAGAARIAGAVEVAERNTELAASVEGFDTEGDPTCDSAGDHSGGRWRRAVALIGLTVGCATVGVMAWYFDLLGRLL